MKKEKKAPTKAPAKKRKRKDAPRISIKKLINDIECDLEVLELASEKQSDLWREVRVAEDRERERFLGAQIALESILDRLKKILPDEKDSEGGK